MLSHTAMPSQAAAAGPVQHRVDPYADNGGTAVAIAGDDYAVIAADTRQSDGYLINSREAPKAFQLSANSVVTCCGFYADATALTTYLKQRIDQYQYDHDKPMSTPALAQLLSITLYHKRFFPYYVHNILAGVDENGKGCIYNYDPVGSFERYNWQAAGSGVSLIQPFLDNQVGFKNMPQEKNPPSLPLDKAIQLVKDAFTSATERDIYTGDQVEIYIITKDGVRKESYPLKRD
ncbi:proteasome beta subunit [Catenaria anguillulae PL171]|uniref:Proteasome subunit beta n=1 Tax=Catenaria anguillulae PL171 TaxID=765915 RepID=A0A1Y2HKT5_9FUNG|nr:proteasome beta subunit [Catenaria anguillulae PL171]